MAALFTLQVKLSQATSNEKTVIEWNNLTEPDTERIWREIYKSGCKYRVGPTTFDIISPFIIKQVFVIQQKEKI